MTEILEFLKVYKDVGVAGLFIALELVTVYLFYKELKDRNQQIAQITERVVTALDKSSDSIEKNSVVLVNVGKSLDQNTHETANFIAFVRGRDSAGRN